MSRQGPDFQMPLFRVVCAVGLLTLVAVGGDEVREHQKIAAGDVQVIAEGLRSYAAAQNRYPGDLNEVIDAGVLEKPLVPDYMSVLPQLDPWGRPYWYWTNGEHFIAGSGGASSEDEKWRTELSVEPSDAAIVLQALCSAPERSSVLLVDGRFCALPKDITDAPATGELAEQERQALTVRDVHMIAIAVMSYSIDNNAYPVLADESTEVQALQPLLEPLYIRGLPLLDGWDRSYLYWSDGKNFLVYSTAGDSADQDYSVLLQNVEDSAMQLTSICIGAHRRPGADIIFANGEACRWPEGFLDD